jgi:hypothetical protein
MQATVFCLEQSMTELEDDQIDFDRVVNDPEYRRHVIVYLNTQEHGENEMPAGGRKPVYKMLRPEAGVYPVLRRLG